MDSLFNNIQHIIQTQQWMAFLAVFVAGLISAASPCVLAAIPLIIGMWAATQGETRKRQRFTRLRSFSDCPSPLRSWAQPEFV